MSKFLIVTEPQLNNQNRKVAVRASRVKLIEAPESCDPRFIVTYRGDGWLARAYATAADLFAANLPVPQ
jgi:hypothetical protein